MSNESNKAKRKIGLKVIICLSLLLIAAGVTVGFIAHNNHQMMLSQVEISGIYENIFINDIDISNLTKDEAKQKIYDEVQKVSDNKKITLNTGDSSFDFHFSDFELQYEIDSAIEKAYSFAREGSLKERYDAITALKETPYKIVLDSKYNEGSVTDILSTISEEVYIEPINATIKRQDGQFITTEGIDGQQMNIEGTATEVKKLIDARTEGQVNVLIEPIAPKYKAADFENAKSLIGTGSSNYSGRGSGRVTNMDVAASKINANVVYPGEIFSTNQALGPSTYENGYRDAPVIVSGELVEGIGGGVCQISSTLYNAILNAELEIVERQNHSQKVGYYDWGFDATLAGDYIDLKFKNNTDLPVLIESYLTANKVIVNIYGKEIHDSSRNLVFKNALISTLPPPAEKVLYDANYPKGQRKTKISALTGYKYEVYKFVYENGVLLEKTLVNTSTYRPRRAEVIVGTGGGASNVASSNDPPPNNNETATPTTLENPVPVQPSVPENTPAPEPTPVQTPEPPPAVEEYSEPIAIEQVTID